MSDNKGDQDQEQQIISYDEAYQKTLDYFDGDELASQVFLSKYALKNENGDLLESTPDDMHKRLAKEFARIEQKYPNPLSEQEIYEHLKGFKKIVAQGSPMAGIGNEDYIMSLGNCFVAGTKVHTLNRGTVSIEEIEVGDDVVTHSGNKRKVIQKHKNKLKNRKIYEVKCIRTPKMKVTENHEFMSITMEQLQWGEKPQFNSIDKLRIGDYIQIPQYSESENAPLIDICKELGVSDNMLYDEKRNRTYLIKEVDNFLYVNTIFSRKSKFGNNISLHRKHKHPLPSTIEMDSDFAYFIGLWYGDGCIFDDKRNIQHIKAQRNRSAEIEKRRVRGITFTFGSHEHSLISFTKNFIKERLQIEPDINNNNNDNTTQIVIHSTILALLFEKMFNRGNQYKKLHNSMHKWSYKCVTSLAQGLLDSDGTITKSGDMRIILNNQVLIEDFYHLLRSRGIFVGYSETERYGKKLARLDFGRNDDFRLKSNKTYSDKRLSEKLGTNTQGVIEINGNKFTKISSKTPSNENPDYVYTFGVDKDHSYSVNGLIAKNCFVLPSPYDSIPGILKTDQEFANISRRRGGTGFDISTLRPKGLPTANAAGTTDGIGPFMERYSNTCREIAQSGRRAALMITISVHHPEIRTFTHIKQNLNKVTGANISIRLSDEFMNAVKNGKKFQLRWPVDNFENPTISEYIDAKRLWHEIITCAHNSAEPGLLFWDKITNESPADCYYEEGYQTKSTNPCGELPIGNYGSCRLLLLNTTTYVNNPFQKNAHFDHERFNKDARVAQRLMDDIVDLELECIDRILNKVYSDPEPEYIKSTEINLWKQVRKTCENGRRTGLGVTGIGDTIAYLNQRYGSKESIESIEEIYKTLGVSSYEESINLAKDRGAFPVWDYQKEKDNPFINRIIENGPDYLRDAWKQYGRRNIANLTTAPCGSVSMLTQTTSGIEPAFLVAYNRRRKINPSDKNSRVDFVDDLGDKWQEYKVYHHGFKKWMDTTGKTEDQFEESPYYKATSNDINWKAGVELQARANRFIDHSISRTTNLPKNTSVEKVKEIYEEAWKQGCKGFTIYREGSRSGVLLSDEEYKKQKQQNTLEENHAPKRPESLPCDIYHIQVKGERWNVFIGLYDGKPFEVFAGRSKHISLPRSRTEGYIKKNGAYNLHTGEGDNELVIEDLSTVFDNPTEAAFTRTISLALRHGTPVQYVMEQIEKGSYSDSDMFSLSKGLVRILKKYLPENAKPSQKKCYDCGGENLFYQEGCVTCADCGSSKCN